MAFLSLQTCGCLNFIQDDSGIILPPPQPHLQQSNFYQHRKMTSMSCEISINNISVLDGCWNGNKNCKGHVDHQKICLCTVYIKHVCRAIQHLHDQHLAWPGQEHKEFLSNEISGFPARPIGRKPAQASCTEPGRAWAEEAAQSGLRLRLRIWQAVLTAQSSGLGIGGRRPWLRPQAVGHRSPSPRVSLINSKDDSHFDLFMV